MILILTTKYYEQGTTPVVDWLIYNRTPYIIIHYEDLVSKSNRYVLDLINKDIIVDGVSVKSRIKVVFYRRFFLSSKIFNYNDDDAIAKQLHLECLSELESIANYLRHFFIDIPQFPIKQTYGENKLLYLEYALQVGLQCPKSLITNNKDDVLKFYRDCENIVSKPIYYSNNYYINEVTYSVRTIKYTEEMIENLSDFFFPTLFQEAINSIYEIRSFFLDGKFYSTAAIFMGKNKNIDIKLNYRSTNLNWVSFKLPLIIEEKLDLFMRKMNLNTGSIDLLRTNDDFIFLEVNPVGQYSAPSDYCNYYLEYEISEYLRDKLNIPI